MKNLYATKSRKHDQALNDNLPFRYGVPPVVTPGVETFQGVKQFRYKTGAEELCVIVRRAAATKKPIL